MSRRHSILPVSASTWSHSPCIHREIGVGMVSVRLCPQAGQVIVAVATTHKGEHMKPDLDAIKEQVQIFDPGLKPDEYAFQSAVILMVAASVTGPYVERIASFTKYQPTLVAMQFFLFALSPHHASWICTRKIIQRE
jgi:hypothetical protein